MTGNGARVAAAIALSLAFHAALLPFAVGKGKQTAPHSEKQMAFQLVDSAKTHVDIAKNDASIAKTGADITKTDGKAAEWRQQNQFRGSQREPQPPARSADVDIPKNDADIPKNDDDISSPETPAYHSLTVDMTRPGIDKKTVARNLVYPSAARRRGIEGIVYLELEVSATGVLDTIRVIKEEPAGYGFADAAAAAFVGIKAKPASRNGVPLAVRYRYPVIFKLK